VARFTRTVDHAGELVYDGLWFSPLRKRGTRSPRRPCAARQGEILLNLHGGARVVTVRRRVVACNELLACTYYER